MAIPYATTNTSVFNLDLNDIIEESFERCGAELRSGYDFKTARRSLSLLVLEWANRGINLWTVEQGEIPIVAGTITYDLPVDTVDLIEHVIRTGSDTTQQDINITRISVSTYSSIPNKNASGRPIQVWINRQSGALNADATLQNPQINIWPTGVSGQTYTFVYWRLRRIFDVAGTGITGQDIPFRFLPCMIAGLSYYLSMKIPGAETRTQLLKQLYDEAFQLAADEDREKAAIRFVPRETFIGNR